MTIDAGQTAALGCVFLEMYNISMHFRSPTLAIIPDMFSCHNWD